MTDIRAQFAALEKGVQLHDNRFTLRVLRSISIYRKHLSNVILIRVLKENFDTQNRITQELLRVLGDDASGGSTTNGTGNVKDHKPETSIFMALLTQILMVDHKQYQAGAKFSEGLVKSLQTLNRRTMDPLSSRIYFYYSLFCEHLHPRAPHQSSPFTAVRPQLLNGLRTATVRKDPDTQATVLTLLLRNYLAFSQVSAADSLISHTSFPLSASNSQQARYLYYLGRIRAIQLDYTTSHEHLTLASRKTPSSKSSIGFALATTKLLIVVELLMGDIPDRATFRDQTLENAMKPYLSLVQAVRVGNLEGFSETLRKYQSSFRHDSTYTLIQRLRQNVIRTGIRLMSLSYSKISLKDICMRLNLESEQSAEYVVAKAIRDGVIEASLDHDRGIMVSKEQGDVYATREPGEAFHERIRACLSLHDESVRAMRFPINQHRLELKNAQEARERERELAKEIQEGDLDDDDGGADFEGM